MATNVNDPRWSEWPFVDLETLPKDQQERLQAARDAWDCLHATGDRTGLVELGILPAESTIARLLRQTRISSVKPASPPSFPRRRESTATKPEATG